MNERAIPCRFVFDEGRGRNFRGSGAFTVAEAGASPVFILFVEG